MKTFHRLYDCSRVYYTTGLRQHLFYKIRKISRPSHSSLVQIPDFIPPMLGIICRPHITMPDIFFTSIISTRDYFSTCLQAFTRYSMYLLSTRMSPLPGDDANGLTFLWIIIDRPWRAILHLKLFDDSTLIAFRHASPALPLSPSTRTHRLLNTAGRYSPGHYLGQRVYSAEYSIIH
jgi:hypothetical protein